jgi:thiol-disulfide isomerase/thioredoxin
MIAFIAAPNYRPVFVKEFPDDDSVIVDEPAQQAWDVKLKELGALLLVAPDASREQRETYEWSQFATKFGNTSRFVRYTKMARSQDERVQGLKELRKLFDEHAAKYAGLQNTISRATLLADEAHPETIVVTRANDYLGAMGHEDRDRAEQEWKHLLGSPNLLLHDEARRKMDNIQRRDQFRSLAFTAMDGREVAIEKMRGKVVLIDFWATWCGPCRTEIPNLKSVYDTYHDKGLEIVSISLDFARDREKLLEFCEANAIPWPQHFDGQGQQNEIAIKHGINMIPACYLLDKDGRVLQTELPGGLMVPRNVRGANLESAVKAALGSR